MRRRMFLYFYAFALGALLTLAQAPFGFWETPFIAFPLFLRSLDISATRDFPRSSAFWLGWFFAFGFFTTGLYWIGASMLVEAGKFWWALPLAIAGLPAYLALYPALAILLWQILRRTWALPPLAALPLFAALWSAAEWLRGHALTGFPWLLLGYDWQAIPSVEQGLSLWGAYGLGLLGLLFYTWPWAFFATCLDRSRQPARTQTIGVCGFGVLLALGFLALATWGQQRLALHLPATSRIHLRLVQPDIPQKIKLDRNRQEEIVNRLVTMSQTPSDLTDKAAVNVTIWPEAAIGFYPQYDRELRKRLRLAVPYGHDGALVFGAPASDGVPGEKGTRYYNSLFAIDRDGNLTGRYDKSHLVPFGEFFPLRSLLSAAGIDISAIAAGSVDYSFGDGVRALTLPGVARASPLICYEIIFPGDVMARNPDGTRAAWLLNITNDAWFGRTTGPYQHLAIARARAIEEGTPLVRTANTGISAIVDSFGRVEERLGLDESGEIDGWLPPPAPQPTPFSLYGNKIYALLWLACVILTILLGGSRRTAQPSPTLPKDQK